MTSPAWATPRRSGLSATEPDGEGGSGGSADALLRIGLVSYLNTLPLFRGLEGRSDLTLRFAPPSALAASMERGELDVALLPAAALLVQPELEVVPGVGIAAEGAVESVILAHRVPPSEVRSLALDPHSRTSQRLARICLRELHGVTPETHECTPREAWQEGKADAVLVIGDLALEMFDEGIPCLDLAAEWKRLTGLPMVFAVWAARPGLLAQRPGIAETLREARDRGERELPGIAAEAAPGTPFSPERLRVYLADRIRYRLAAREEAGLRRYLEMAAALPE